jgi:hypothetical protein
MFLSLL